MIQDYIPFMDKYPELHLRPTTEFQNVTKIKNYDYIQDLNLSGDKALNGYFYLLVKDNKFGVFMFHQGFFFPSTSISLEPQYDSIKFTYTEGESFGAIVQQEGLFGLIFWKYDSLSWNDVYKVKPVYNSIIYLSELKRYKATKDGVITYFDYAGHLLK